MPHDDGTLARCQRAVEDRVAIGGEVPQTVASASRNAAAPVPAMVERDHPVARAREVGDLVGPRPDRAGDAVREDYRISVPGPEDLGVQTGAVRRTHLDSAAAGQSHRKGGSL